MWIQYPSVNAVTMKASRLASVFRNLCCDSEVRLIERIVTQLPGVESVSINTFQKICIMVHCPRCSTPDSVMTKLNRAGLGAALLGQGNLEIHPVTPTIRDMVLSHSRHLIVEISALLMFLGVLCSSVANHWGQLPFVGLAAWSLQYFAPVIDLIAKK